MAAIPAVAVGGFNFVPLHCRSASAWVEAMAVAVGAVVVTAYKGAVEVRAVIIPYI